MNESEAFEIVLSRMKPILSAYETEFYNGNLSEAVRKSVGNLRTAVGVLETELNIINGCEQ